MRKILYLIVALALPRVYMIDWSLTPPELLENYVTNSNDYVMSSGNGKVVFISVDATRGEEDGKEDEKES
jgi:hypothetical protein